MHSRLHSTSGFIVLASLLTVAACTDEIPVTSPEGAAQDELAQPAGSQNVVASVTCTANVTEGELACGEVPVVDEQTGLQRVILGGQGMFVQLFSPIVNYNSTTQVFQATVYLVNLIPQGLGSPDGRTTTGIKIFTHSGPTVTSSTGPGVVTEDSTDGTGDFTGVMQPYRLYDQWVPAADLPIAYSTAWKTWYWTVPNTVNTFEFEVFVAADVVGEDGFVSMSPKTYLMSVGGGDSVVTGTALDVVGRPTGNTVTYTSSDQTIATVNPNTGAVTPVSAGIVDIIGSTTGPEVAGRTRITIDPPPGAFDIDLHFVNTVTPAQRAAFDAAALKWESLIIGDLPLDTVVNPFLSCGDGPIEEIVDDLVINVLLDSIDGPSGTLGFAGPCMLRPGLGGLPSYGFMVFDTADVGLAQFGDVVLHEMGHVLGVGILWFDGLMQDGVGAPIDDYDTCFPPGDPPPLAPDPHFVGDSALAAFARNGGGTYAGNSVPVEDDFGPGTRCVHWRESVLDNELMTGFVEASPPPPPPQVWMPLSEVTVKSFFDAGYTVAASGWDTWTCPSCTSPPGAPAVDASAGDIQLINDVYLGPIYSRNEAGEVIVVVPDRRR